MISKSLSTSEKRAALHTRCPKLAEFCQSIYPLLVAHADDQGRLPGDEFTVKHMIDPTSPRKLPEFVAALHLLHEVGLILWYQVTSGPAGTPKKIIEIVAFSDHQDLKGHDKRPGKFPPCPDATALIGRDRRLEARAQLVPPESSINTGVGESGGKFPQTSPKRTEEKGTEENLDMSARPKAPSESREFLLWFVEEYKRRRNGAVYFVTWQKHMAIIKRLLGGFPQKRLRELAIVLLTTDEEWTTNTDRGIEVFAARINWLEEKLCAWEAKKRSREAV